MNDGTLLHQFEACQLPLEEWHHSTHVKIAYLYLLHFGPDIAARKLRDGIRTYNAAHHVEETDTSGYHETMTQAWLRIIHTTLQEYGPCATADEFLEFHPQLGQKKILRLFYSPTLFMSPQARREFVEPDLTGLPHSPGTAGGAI